MSCQASRSRIKKTRHITCLNSKGYISVGSKRSKTKRTTSWNGSETEWQRWRELKTKTRRKNTVLDWIIKQKSKNKSRTRSVVGRKNSRLKQIVKENRRMRDAQQQTTMPVEFHTSGNSGRRVQRTPYDSRLKLLSWSRWEKESKTSSTASNWRRTSVSAR